MKRHQQQEDEYEDEYDDHYPRASGYHQDEYDDQQYPASDVDQANPVNPTLLNPPLFGTQNYDISTQNERLMKDYDEYVSVEQENKFPALTKHDRKRQLARKATLTRESDGVGGVGDVAGGNGAVRVTNWEPVDDVDVEQNGDFDQVEDIPNEDNEAHFQGDHAVGPVDEFQRSTEPTVNTLPQYTLDLLYEEQIDAKFLEKLQKDHVRSQRLYPLPESVYKDSIFTLDPNLVGITHQTQYTHIRYTPVTTLDPANMGMDGYTCRTIAARGAARRVKLAVCVTLYNEDWREVEKSLHGVMGNVDYLVQHGLCAWYEVVVVVVQDGVQCVEESVVAGGDRWGFYSSDVVGRYEVKGGGGRGGG